MKKPPVKIPSAKGEALPRRKFFKQGVSTLATISVLPSHVLRSQSEVRDRDGRLLRAASRVPSERVNLACCGIGNQGGSDLRSMHQTGLVNIVAFCDVDMGAKHTLKSLKQWPTLPRFQDFREMFDKMSGSIDAVTVGTPDFSHFPIAMLAMSQGKHVYVEKPLTRTFHESELLMRASRKYKVATQMGNQGHCQDNYYQFKTWVEKGIIREVREITAHMNGGRRWHGWDTSITRFPKGQPLPETLDWDTWLMTAQHHAYHRDFVRGQWRCWYDFGMGALGDWGAHIMDGFHQFLELGLPEVIRPLRIEGHNPLFYPQASTLEFQFPERGKLPPVKVTWYDGKNNHPRVPEGYGGIQIDRDIPPLHGRVMPAQELPAGKEIYGKDLTFKGHSHGSTLSIVPEEKAADLSPDLLEFPRHPNNHYTNFLLACQGKEACLSPFEVAAPLSQVFCLGVLAQKFNTRLLFDRQSKQITNHALANAWLKGTPPRKGWEEFYRLA
ncbi:MAG: Gfo/Idh/MocA family oxidoreductase [Verrucomicrobiota bacterium]|nr:Gfo/Idh/MocA family oxidoreductase [Verrucomicrobiota bacterium]